MSNLVFDNYTTDFEKAIVLLAENNEEHVSCSDTESYIGVVHLDDFANQSCDPFIEKATKNAKAGFYVFSHIFDYGTTSVHGPYDSFQLALRKYTIFVSSMDF